MGLGVLDDNHLEHVPGTAPLIDVINAEATSSRRLDTALLKHAKSKGRDSDVLLVPQPSRSPNDPLNWPLWKKDLMLFLICTLIDRYNKSRAYAATTRDCLSLARLSSSTQ